MTLPKARKILGKSVEHLSDEQLQKEVDNANLFSGLMMISYKEDKIKNNKPQINHA